MAHTPSRMQPTLAVVFACMLISIFATEEGISNIKYSEKYESSPRSQKSTHTSVPRELATRRLFEFDAREMLDSEIIESISTRRKLDIVHSPRYLRRMKAINYKPIVKIDFGTTVSKVPISNALASSTEFTVLPP